MLFSPTQKNSVEESIIPLLSMSRVAGMMQAQSSGTYITES